MNPTRTTRERISRVELRARRAKCPVWRDRYERLARFLEAILTVKAQRGEETRAATLVGGKR